MGTSVPHLPHTHTTWIATFADLVGPVGGIFFSPEALAFFSPGALTIDRGAGNVRRGRIKQFKKNPIHATRNVYNLAARLQRGHRFDLQHCTLRTGFPRLGGDAPTSSNRAPCRPGHARPRDLGGIVCLDAESLRERMRNMVPTDRLRARPRTAYYEND